MGTQVVQLKRRRWGETLRRDTWWASPAAVFIVLSAFVVYATWAAFQNAHYEFGNYLSPFYSPALFDDSAHAWFGPKPAAWPGWPPFSPALLILPFPAGFRLTCYYYRGAYYKAFWSDPPNCTVGEPRSGYRGESAFPLILQNVHRYFLYIALGFLLILAYDAWKAMWFAGPGGGAQQEFGIGIGTLLLTANVILLGGYTFGCHSLRHLVGGRTDELARHPVQHTAYRCVSCFNRNHMKWAWASLVTVAFRDLYIRLCSMGIWTGVRLL